MLAEDAACVVLTFPVDSRWGRFVPELHESGLSRVRIKQQAAFRPCCIRTDTCRVQFVDAKQNPLFHSLINRFRELTGVPLVLNTSFNDQEPLVATPDDALKTFARSGSMPSFWEIALSDDHD